ncbi:hypothetical protein CFC21_023115 [Triticum aestivum]|uniref:Uncharacterized protein n=2 Tax=Triticum aestivum TaxID=4565 RepID=A0A9R1EE20_WHEAT|nr:hypothetical protein CFC21_023115 [Triticum aestivum]
MVIPPPDRAARIVSFLKPNLLRMDFSNKFVTAQVIHTPTTTVPCSASSQEKLLRSHIEQKYHGKVTAVIDSVGEAGVKLL